MYTVHLSCKLRPRKEGWERASSNDYYTLLASVDKETVAAVCSYARRSPTFSNELATWLILPVVICLSQRLSHACVSTSFDPVKPRMAH